MSESGRICSGRRAGARNATGHCGAAGRSLALAVLVVSLLVGCTPLPAAAPAVSPAPDVGPIAAQAPSAAPAAEGAPSAGPTAAQAPTAGPAAAQAPTAGPTAVQAPTAGPTAAQAPTSGPAAAQVPTAGPTAAPAPAAPALDCPGCPSMDEFCPEKPGYLRCYTCSKKFEPIGQKGSCDQTCDVLGVNVGGCSLSGNSQLEKDYVWTCTYTKQNTGCCQRGDSCTDESSQAACSGEGAIWHKGACCEDVAACGGSGGCCKYTDGTCAGGVTHKACTAAANSQEWSVGACPPAPDCIPEPATVLLVMSGFGAAGFYLRRRRARR